MRFRFLLSEGEWKKRKAEKRERSGIDAYIYTHTHSSTVNFSVLLPSWNHRVTREVVAVGG